MRAPIAVDARGRLQLLDQFEDSGLGWFWATDSDGRLIYISKSAAAQLGKEPGELEGSALSGLFILDRDEDAEKAERPLAFLLSARQSITELPVRVAVEGREVWWAISAKPQLDGAGEFLGYRGSAKDITAVRESQRDASRMAQYDSLTGLANRHRMSKRLDAILVAYKAAKRSCALMMLDLDRFKAVNDTLGHPAGDELLKQVAQRLERIIGTQGEIGRLGGDEFQVIIPDLDDRGKLGELADRVIQMVSQPYSIEGARAIIGTSVGIAIAPYDGIDRDELISSADLALYAAKGGGRGQFRFYSNNLKDAAKERRLIEEDLRDALVNEQLRLVYQPLVSPLDNVVRGFEALMRWDHPERGAISPAVFIPIAEETNLIIELGEWALRTACADAAKWPLEQRLAVNVSPIQFANESLPNVVKAALNRSGLAPARLELEITESIFMGDREATDRMFKALKKIGVRMALDDFGTGFSSLGYLRHAPFDKIKIDKSFVRGSTDEETGNAAIVTAIASLARALKMECTAEGVEAMDELELVRKQDIDTVQGFIYGQGRTQAEVLEMSAAVPITIDPHGPSKQRPERRTVYRKIGLIHEDHRYEVTMRNLSRTGAMVKGLLDIPLGTQFVVDFGEGQLVVGTVRRSEEDSQGLEFEVPLISDGADGWCTRQRISPYVLASAGMPLAALPPGAYPLVGNAPEGKGFSMPKFAQPNDLPNRTRAA